MNTSSQKHGMAAPGIIPGRRKPAIADDVEINAKKGEYLFRDDVVAAVGAKFFDNLQAEIIKKHGLPPLVTGAKRHNQADSMGRMDKPGLKGMAGYAGSGSITDDQGQVYNYVPDSQEPAVASVPSVPSATPQSRLPDFSSGIMERSQVAPTDIDKLINAVPTPQSAQQHLLAITNGNTTWDMKPAQQAALAAANMKNDQELYNQRIGMINHIVPADIQAQSSVAGHNINMQGTLVNNATNRVKANMDMSQFDKNLELKNRSMGQEDTKLALEKMKIEQDGATKRVFAGEAHDKNRLTSEQNLRTSELKLEAARSKMNTGSDAEREAAENEYNAMRNQFENDRNIHETTYYTPEQRAAIAQTRKDRDVGKKITEWQGRQDDTSWYERQRSVEDKIKTLEAAGYERKDIEKHLPGASIIYASRTPANSGGMAPNDVKAPVRRKPNIDINSLYK